MKALSNRRSGYLPRLYHISLISKPICLLISPYLKRKTEPPLKKPQPNLIPRSRNISFQNLISMQKYLELQSRFSKSNQLNNAAQPPSPAQWWARKPQPFPHVPFTKEWHTEAAWHVQATPKASATQPPTSVPCLPLPALPLKTPNFHFCSSTHQRENTH